MSNVNKLYIKPTINSALNLAVVVKLGVEILKRSNNADVKLNNQTLSDESLGVMILTDVKNEMSKVGE